MPRAKRHHKSPTAWRDSPQGVESYRCIRAEAQAQANLYGFDYGLEASDLNESWRYFMLPERRNRYGHETTCEVVMCERVERCRPGHGPHATRPPSTVGPDYHGGPWVGREAALRLCREWEALDKPC